MGRELAQTLTGRGSIREMGAALDAGLVSAADLAEAALDRIERQDDRVNAFVAVSAEKALEAAAASDARRNSGARLGPLDGVPYALKDLIDAEGWVTTGGSRAMSDAPKRRDAGVTARLRAAGAVLLGKTGLHELAYGVTSENPHFGSVRNPWDLERSPGGSSGGSGAAVSAAMAPLAIGTDTGCSIRHPAHCCGVVGFKPSHGRVSAAGVAPLVRQLDHIGPLTRSVEDAALAMDVLAGFDPEDPLAQRYDEPLRALAAVEAAGDGGAPLRIGRLRGEAFEAGDAETLALVESAVRTIAEGLDAALVDFEPPGLRRMLQAAGGLFSGDPSASYGAALRRQPELFGEDVRRKLEYGLRAGAGALASAQHEARCFRRGVEVSQSEAKLDLLIGPTCGAPAPKILIDPELNRPAGADPWADYATIACTPFNVTGQPAISIPCGKTAAGLPVGVMLVAARGQDAELLSAAARAERALAMGGHWRGQRPPL